MWLLRRRPLSSQGTGSSVSSTSSTEDRGAVALGPWTAHPCDGPGPSGNRHPTSSSQTHVARHPIRVFTAWLAPAPDGNNPTVHLQGLVGSAGLRPDSGAFWGSGEAGGAGVLSTELGAWQPRPESWLHQSLSCGAGQVLHQSVPQFPHPQNGDDEDNRTPP